MKYFPYLIGALLGAIFSPIVLYFYIYKTFYFAPNNWVSWTSLYQNEFLFPPHGESIFANPNFYVGAVLGALNVQWLTKGHAQRQAWLNILVGASIGAYYLWNIGTFFRSVPVDSSNDYVYKWNHDALMTSLLLYSPLVVGAIALLILGIVNCISSEQRHRIRPYAITLVSALAGAVFLPFLLWGSARIFVTLVPVSAFSSLNYMGSSPLSTRFPVVSPYLISPQIIGAGLVLGFATALLLCNRVHQFLIRSICILAGIGATFSIYNIIRGLYYTAPPFSSMTSIIHIYAIYIPNIYQFFTVIAFFTPAVLWGLSLTLFALTLNLRSKNVTQTPTDLSNNIHSVANAG